MTNWTWWLVIYVFLKCFLSVHLCQSSRWQIWHCIWQAHKQCLGLSTMCEYWTKVQAFALHKHAMYNCCAPPAIQTLHMAHLDCYTGSSSGGSCFKSCYSHWTYTMTAFQATSTCLVTSRAYSQLDGDTLLPICIYHSFHSLKLFAISHCVVCLMVSDVAVLEGLKTGTLDEATSDGRLLQQLWLSRMWLWDEELLTILCSIIKSSAATASDGGISTNSKFSLEM